MSTLTSTITRRTDLLRGAIRHRIALNRKLLHPPGGGPAFHQQRTSEEAWAFWKKHRYDRTGALAMMGMSPRDIALLDAWMAEKTASEQEQPILR